jgi:AraC family transcriptional regulator
LQILRTRTKSRPATASAYLEAVNNAIDYILAHLDRPLRLQTIARAAHLSPYHFHRVFQVVTSQTIADFVRRVRFERALVLMSRQPPPSLTSIALACGFASSSEFSRGFKKHFGSAPRSFDLESWRAAHRDALEMTVSKWRDQFHAQSLPSRANPDSFKVRVRDIEPRTVAYIRVLNPYKGTGVIRAYERLQAWAASHGFLDNQWLGYQWENPELTNLADCQYYVAVEASGFTQRGEIGRFRFPAMTVAQVEIKGGIELELRALQWLYGSWLPRSGYVPTDHPGFEAWIGRPLAHGMEHFEINIQIPIQRAR